MGQQGDAMNSPGDVMRRLHDHDRQITALQTARRSEATSIGAGGMRVRDGGTITILDGDGEPALTLSADDGLKLAGILQMLAGANIETYDEDGNLRAELGNVIRFTDPDIGEVVTSLGELASGAYGLHISGAGDVDLGVHRKGYFLATYADGTTAILVSDNPIDEILLEYPDGTFAQRVSDDRWAVAYPDIGGSGTAVEVDDELAVTRPWHPRRGAADHRGRRAAVRRGHRLGRGPVRPGHCRCSRLCGDGVQDAADPELRATQWTTATSHGLWPTRSGSRTTPRTCPPGTPVRPAGTCPRPCSSLSGGRTTALPWRCARAARSRRSACPGRWTTGSGTGCGEDSRRLSGPVRPRDGSAVAVLFAPLDLHVRMTVSESLDHRTKCVAGAEDDQVDALLHKSFPCSLRQVRHRPMFGRRIPLDVSASILELAHEHRDWGAARVADVVLAYIVGCRHARLLFQGSESQSGAGKSTELPEPAVELVEAARPDAPGPARFVRSEMEVIASAVPLPPSQGVVATFSVTAEQASSEQRPWPRNEAVTATVANVAAQAQQREDMGILWAP